MQLAKILQEKYQDLRMQYFRALGCIDVRDLKGDLVSIIHSNQIRSHRGISYTSIEDPEFLNILDKMMVAPIDGRSTASWCYKK